MGVLLRGRIQGGCIPDGGRRAEQVAKVLLRYVNPSRVYGTPHVEMMHWQAVAS